MTVAVPRRRHIRALAAAVAGAALLLAACSSSHHSGAAGGSSGPSPSITAAPGQVLGVPPNEVTTVPPGHDRSLEAAKVTLTDVADLGTAATALEQRPGTGDLYVAELDGRVLRLTPTADDHLAPAPQPVLDIANEVGSRDEEGLLGLAFSTDGGTLYVSYAALDGTSMVDAYRMAGDTADPATRRNLLTVTAGKGRTIHKGGALHLGPDGMLWLGLGDGGPEDDPQDNAQNPKLLLGKVLRIDPASGKTSVWASGLRNPYRFSFDRAGNIWIGDVGQDKVEEIDWLPASTPPGANFGWSGFEGTNVFRRDRLPARSVPPVIEMFHTDGWCAVMGGVVVTDPRLPKLDGAYVYGDLCRPQLRAIKVDASGRVTDERDLAGVDVKALIGIDTDAAGRVYFLTQTGEIDRLDPA